MIVLDTNLISEIMKASPSYRVMQWFEKQKIIELFITTITIAEISYGIQALPEGKRRYLLEENFKKTITEGFEFRILAFNELAAQKYGQIMAKRKQLGLPMSILDGQIAAVTLANKGVIATRNVKDFSSCGLEIMNPFG